MTSGKPQLTTVSINGVTVDSYLQSWEMNTNNDNSTIRLMKITLSRAAEAVLTLDDTLNEKPVSVQRGEALATETYVFRGVVLNVIPNGSIVEVICADNLYLTTKRKATTSFDINIDAEAGVYSEIFKSLVNEFTQLVADSSSVQSSGTTLTTKKFICRSANVFERLKTIADTISWQFYYNPNDNRVHFEPKGTESQSTTLSTGTNILEVPKWNYDSQQLYNVVELHGAYQEVETVEIGQIDVTAGYTTSEFPFTKEPISVRIYVDAANPPTTLKTGGKSGSTATYDYSVDVPNKKGKWNTAQFTPTTNHYVKKEYSYAVPTPVLTDDPDSIAALENGSPGDPDYDDGKREITIHKYDITEVSDAEVYAVQFLEDHKDPVLKTTLKVTNVSDLEVGQAVELVDEFNGISDTFYVVRIKRTWPYRYDEVEVVSNVIDENKYTWNIQQRVKRLEEQNMGDSDLLLHVVGATRTIKYEPRYAYAEKKTYSPGTLSIVGNPSFNTIPWTVGGGSASFVPARIVQGNNIYKEFLYDNDFKNSTETDANWDTSAKTVTFASAVKKLQTTPIVLGPEYSYVTATMASLTGEVHPDYKPLHKLVSYYGLDTTDTQSASGVVDRHGANEGTATGFTLNSGTDTSMTYSGGKAVFDGSSGYITLANENNFDIGAGESWSYCFKLTAGSTSSGQRIFSKYNGSATGHIEFTTFAGGKIQALFRNASTNNPLTSNGTFSVGVEVHVGISYNSATGATEIVWNGVSDNTNTQAVTMGTNAQAAVLGARASDLSGKLNASMRQFRVWKGVALSAAQFAAEMASDYPVRGAGLVANYQLATNSVDTHYIVAGPNATFATAWNFNGTSEYVTIADDTTLSPQVAVGAATWAWWIKQDTLPGSTAWSYGKGAASNWEYAIEHDTSGNIRFKLWDSAGSTYANGTNSSLGTGTWKRYVVTYDGTNLKSYLNGVLQGNVTSFTGSLSNGTAAMVIGGRNSSGLKEVQMCGCLVASRAWDQADVTNDYNSGTGLAYPFYTGTPDNVIEISADGGTTWQEITLGTRTALSTVDENGVLLRAYGTAGTVIANTYDAYNQYNEPAIKVVFE